MFSALGTGKRPPRLFDGIDWDFFADREAGAGPRGMLFAPQNPWLSWKRATET